MTQESAGRPEAEVEETTIEGVWTQSDTPGSDVELEKLPNPAEEATTEIDAAVTELESPASPVDDEIVFPESEVDEPEAEPTTVVEGLGDEDPRIADVEAAIARANQEAAERARAEAQRLADERAARNRALGVVASSNVEVAPAPPPQKLVTDRLLGAFSLFILRLIVAGILGARGYQMLTDIPRLQSELGATQLPQPNTMAWVAGVTALLLAVAFFFGAFVRVAGFGLVVLAISVLVFLRWGQFSPFLPGQAGFYGELELLLAGVGLVFLCIGGGLWGIDGIFRRRRARVRAARAD